jgi:hypothetical protein
MGSISKLKPLPVIVLLLAITAANASQPATLGRSVDDMVGAFSIEKTIKLGDRGFFGPSESDPLASPVSLDQLSVKIDDDQPPSLSGFEIDPDVVEAASSQSVDFKVHVLDDQAGLGDASSIKFVSPSGSHVVEATLVKESLISGTSRDEVYSGSFMLDQNSEKGTWTLDGITLVDGAGNSRILTRDDLAGMKLPYQFTVV